MRIKWNHKNIRITETEYATSTQVVTTPGVLVVVVNAGDGSAVGFLVTDGTTAIQDLEYVGGGGASTWGSITGTLSAQTDLQAALDARQPLDSDLTAIAALSTQAYGRSLLESANASALRTLAGLVIGTNVAAQTHASQHQHGGTDEVAVATSAANAIPKALATGKLDTSWLPDSILGQLEYQGVWNATTNSPSLSSGTGTKGHYYVVSVAGSTALDGISSWNVGDWAVFNGTTWDKVDNTDAVSTVFGRLGPVLAAASDYDASQVDNDSGVSGAFVDDALDWLLANKQPIDGDLTAIAALSPSNDDIVQRKSGAWTNRTMAQLIADLAALGTTFQPLDAELTAIAGLTSAAHKAIQYTGSGTAALVDLKLGIEAAYGGKITWTAGVDPSGTANLRQFYTQVGNLVTWQISLTYANTGTTVTNVVLTFPTEFPTPAIPTGFSGASARLWNCHSTRLLSTPSGSLTNAGAFMIMRNAADNGFEIASTGSFASGSYRTFIFSGAYFTA